MGWKCLQRKYIAHQTDWSQLPPVKRVAWISPKMGERQRRRHDSESSDSEPRAEHAVCRTIKIIPVIDSICYLVLNVSFNTEERKYGKDRKIFVTAFNRLIQHT